MTTAGILQGKNNRVELGKRTIIMGVLNVTPDSFSDGGKFLTVPNAIRRTKEMLEEGADIIDIGGESTRPNAEKVSSEEELQRVIPVIKALRKEFGDTFLLSIDTYKASIAKEAIHSGADIVNDVSGLQMDVDMPEVLGILQVPVIITHMKGTPQTMQKGEIVYTDIISDICAFFQEKIIVLEKYGVTKNNIVLDPGFGFGKTVVHNVAILKRFHELSVLGLPTLIGISRKSTLGIILQESFRTALPFPPDDRLEASLAGTAVAVLNGATMVRTHDILQTRKFLAVIDRIAYA